MVKAVETLAKPWGELVSYHGFAEKIQQGLLPYRDFTPEYPPLAMPFFWFAQIFGTQWFTLVYYAEVALFAILTSWLIKRLRGNPFVFLALVLPLGGLFWDRFDIFPAFFAFWSVYLAIKRRPRVSAVVLSIATMIKAYPLVLLPVLLLLNGRKATRMIFYFMVPILIVLLAIVSYGGFPGLKFLWEFQGKRGVEIESIKATVPIVKHLKGIKEAEVVYEHYSYEIR